VQQAIERVQPVATQALLSSFRQAMGQAIDDALGAEAAALRGSAEPGERTA